MRVLHDRMPAILEKADWPAWLGETEGDPRALLRPAAEDVLRLWPVSRRVNHVANDGADLLRPGAGGAGIAHSRHGSRAEPRAGSTSN